MDNARAIAVGARLPVASDVLEAEVNRVVGPAMRERDDMTEARRLELDRVAAPAARPAVPGDQVGAHTAPLGIARAERHAMRSRSRSPSHCV